jgi:hypothetical protein
MLWRRRDRRQPRIRREPREWTRWRRARGVTREAAIPPATLDSLRRIFGEAAAEVRVIEHSRHWTFWYPRFVATTRKGRILLRGSAEAFLRDPALVLEEYYHVLRQWQTGELTRWRYVLQALRHGYARNRFEVEAKRFARECAGAYCAPVELSAPAEARRPGSR